MLPHSTLETSKLPKDDNGIDDNAEGEAEDHPAYAAAADDDDDDDDDEDEDEDEDEDDDDDDDDAERQQATISNKKDITIMISTSCFFSGQVSQCFSGQEKRTGDPREDRPSRSCSPCSLSSRLG